MKNLIIFDKFVNENNNVILVRLNMTDGCLYDASGQRQVPQFEYSKCIKRQLGQSSRMEDEEINGWLKNNRINGVICQGALPFPK